MTLVGSASDARDLEEIRPGPLRASGLLERRVDESARDQDVARLAMWRDGKKVQPIPPDSLVNAQPPA